MEEKQMSHKQLDVLFKLIELYIENAEPVGSRALSKVENIEFSPASLRNIMVDLSELSMVDQPHTSAGRVPTDSAYRVYVNQLMQKINFQEERDGNLEEKFNRIEDNLEDLLKGTSELLSEESKMMSIVMTPRPVKSKMKKIEFIPISSHQVLAVLITCAGMVCHKLINTREGMNQKLLDSLSRYFNGKFNSKPLCEVREELLDSLTREMSKQPKEFARALRLSKKAFDLGVSGQIYKFGQNYFFEYPEFSNIEDFAELFNALEDQNNLIQLLERDSESNGVETYIGSEHSMGNLESCSIIVAHYGIEENNLGSLALLGPKRLNYSKIIPLIGHISYLLSERLHRIVE